MGQPSDLPNPLLNRGKQSSRTTPSGLSNPITHRGSGIHYAEQVACEDEHLTGFRCIVDLDGAMASRILVRAYGAGEEVAQRLTLCFW